MGLIAIALTVDVLVTTICLFIAKKKGWLETTASDLLLLISVTSMLMLIPRFGWPISVAAFITLLMVLSKLNLNSSALIAIITKGLSLAVFLLIALIFS